MPPAPLPASVLLALGLSVANADTGDTGDTGDTAMTPCLSVQTCLCGFTEAPASAGVVLGLAAVAAVGRRRRRQDATVEDAVEDVLDRDVLPPDVAEKIRRDR